MRISNITLQSILNSIKNLLPTSRWMGRTVVALAAAAGILSYLFARTVRPSATPILIDTQATRDGSGTVYRSALQGQPFSIVGNASPPTHERKTAQRISGDQGGAWEMPPADLVLAAVLAVRRQTSNTSPAPTELPVTQNLVSPSLRKSPLGALSLGMKILHGLSP
jgi:hypothetical protein